MKLSIALAELDRLIAAGALGLRAGSQQLKEELGLDHFEGRSWRGLHRHALMTMIADAFLQHLRLAAASGRKKNLTRPASADTAGHTKSHRRRPGARSTLPMPALPPANPQIARMRCQSSVRER
jgi:SRSO17 transposase